MASRGVPTVIGRAVAGFFLVGFLRNAAILIPLLVVLFALTTLTQPVFDYFLPRGPWMADWFPFLGDRTSWFGRFPIVPLVILSLPMGWVANSLIEWSESDEFKKMMGESSRTSRIWKRAEQFGRGGSAAFGRLLDEWDDLYEPGEVFLGRSMYDRSRIGSDDPRGVLTIASSRSGKGRSVIIPNLMMWEGSALVIDPKGTNAAVTALARGQGGGRLIRWLGQDVYVVDPFEVVDGVERSGFNPLAAIDLNGLRAREDIELLAEALVPRDAKGGASSRHFEDTSRAIVMGVIAYVLETMKNPTLIDVREALTGSNNELDALFSKMAKSKAAGGLPRNAVRVASSAGEQELGGMMTTVHRQTSWIDSEAMRNVLSQSSFLMSDLKKRPTTVYLILPPDLLDVHGRFLRMFINMMLSALPQGGKGEVPILMIMDEFYSLGPLDSLAKAASSLAGYGLRMWPILHNIGQLLELYGKNAETFFSNAGTVQVFGINDEETAATMSKVMGQRIEEDVVNGRRMQGKVNLIEASELREALSIEDGRQILLRAGKMPLILKKMNYDQAFKQTWYLPDPDHKEKKRGWAALFGG